VASRQRANLFDLASFEQRPLRLGRRSRCRRLKPYRMRPAAGRFVPGGHSSTPFSARL
jgi:hypothetical protein